MNIPGLGEVTKDAQFDWYYSEPINLPLLSGHECKIVIEGYDEDQRPEDFHAAIANLLVCSPSVLKAAEQYVFQYYQDVKSSIDPSGEEIPAIDSADEVWRHVELGTEPIVTRRPYGDMGIYVSIECNCDWEPEHGLQIVLKNGSRVTKVGPYDGHLTNSDAFADESLEDIVYRQASH